MAESEADGDLSERINNQPKELLDQDCRSEAKNPLDDE
jgi:hypothetical protein